MTEAENINVGEQPDRTAELSTGRYSVSGAVAALEDTVIVERTVAFFADPRATGLLLEETVQRLIDALDIQLAIVDLSTLAGVTIARVFRDAGLPFEALEFGQEQRHQEGASTARPEEHPVVQMYMAAAMSRQVRELREQTSRVREVHISELGAIDANIVLIPAMVGQDEKMLDFSTGTVLGTVLGQLEAAGRDFVLVDAPERGLRAMPDGSYQRAIVHVAAEQPNE